MSARVGGVGLWELHPPDVEKCLGPDKLKLSHKLPVLAWGWAAPEGSSACLGSEVL